jgi:hypothetical protein
MLVATVLDRAVTHLEELIDERGVSMDLPLPVRELTCPSGEKTVKATGKSF